MAKTYRAYDPNQNLLLPPSLDEWLNDDHPARYVGDAIDAMDLQPLYASYEAEERGYPPYEPRMMLKILTYGYMVGVRSSRKLQQATEDQVAFRYLAAGNQPNWRTINDYRTRNVDFFKRMFKQVVQMAMAAGLVGLRVVAGDGTKMKANASLAANKNLEKLREEEATLDRYVDGVIREAERVDAKETKRFGEADGISMPKSLASALERRTRIRDAIQQLKQREERLQDAHEEHAQERAAKEAATGRKLRGRKPKPPNPEDSKDKKANTTDPQSRILKTRQGYVQGYNAQAVVDQQTGIVVAAYVTNAENDVHELLPGLEHVKENTGQHPDRTVNDAGYWDPEQVAGVPPETEPFVATAKTHTMRKEAAASPPRGRIPTNLSLRQRMERKLRTKAGWGWYRLRGQTVEPAFGDTRENKGFKNFLLRGIDKANAEWNLVQLGRNLWKIWDRTGAPA